VDQVVGGIRRSLLSAVSRGPLASRLIQTCVVASVAACVVGIAACSARHGAPVIDTGDKPAGVGGTIAGIVRTSGNAASLAGRKVTAINEATGQRFDISTGSNGGYTVQVPAGTYRLEIELRPGEALESRPEPTQVNVGDIDEGKNFVVTASR
jgi:hypothetical protein